VISDKFTGRSRGFGFVEMSTDEQAQKAIEALNETQLEGRALTVNEFIEDSYQFVLASIVVAHDLYQGKTAVLEEQKKRMNKWYWQQREGIERQLEKTSKSDLIRGFWWDIDFYEPGEVDCPHSRRRKKCVEIYGKLVLCEALQKPPANKYFRKRLTKLIEELKKEGVNPFKHNTRDFCPPDYTDRSARIPVLPPEPSPGSPPKQLHNYLLQTVIVRLMDAGLSLRQCCDCAQAILLFCFGDKSAQIESLETQWRRLQPKAKGKSTSAR